MACRLFGAKPLFKSMFDYCQSDPRNKLQRNFIQNFKNFSIEENAFENVVCQNGGHFGQGEMSLYTLKPGGFHDANFVVGLLVVLEVVVTTKLTSWRPSVAISVN